MCVGVFCVNFFSLGNCLCLLYPPFVEIIIVLIIKFNIARDTVVPAEMLKMLHIFMGKFFEDFLS